MPLNFASLYALVTGNRPLPVPVRYRVIGFIFSLPRKPSKRGNRWGELASLYFFHIRFSIVYFLLLLLLLLFLLFYSYRILKRNGKRGKEGGRWEKLNFDLSFKKSRYERKCFDLEIEREDFIPFLFFFSLFLNRNPGGNKREEKR